MKTKKKETDMDFIGGLGSLTAEEENALKAYFKKKKRNMKSPHSNTTAAEAKSM